MINLSGWWHDYKKYCIPRWPENKIILAYVAVGGFILGFEDYNIFREFLPVDPTRQVFAMFLALIGAAIAVYVNVLAQKAWALRRGLHVTSSFSPWKIAAGLFVGVFTAGLIPLIFVPDMSAKILKYQRAGYYRHGINLSDFAKMGFVGMLANLLIAMIFIIIFGLSNPLTNAIIVAMVFTSLANVIPIPLGGGFYTLYHNPMYWALLTGVGILGVYMLYASIGYAILIGLGVSLLMWLVFATQVEKIINI